MSPFLLVPALIGVAAVVQAGLNRQIASRWGLASSVLLSSSVLLAAALSLWLFSRFAPERLPSFFNAPTESKPFAAWYWVPGLLGLLIVAGLPWAIQRAGATLTFVVTIATQMVVSLAWDGLVEGRPFAWVKVAGSALAVAGAVLTALAT
jgi:uncharacterized membrane protein YdcZ (DUF606 family)